MNLGSLEIAITQIDALDLRNKHFRNKLWDKVQIEFGRSWGDVRKVLPELVSFMVIPFEEGVYLPGTGLFECCNKCGRAIPNGETYSRINEGSDGIHLRCVSGMDDEKSTACVDPDKAAKWLTEQFVAHLTLQ